MKTVIECLSESIALAKMRKEEEAVHLDKWRDENGMYPVNNDTLALNRALVYQQGRIDATMEALNLVKVHLEAKGEK